MALDEGLKNIAKGIVEVIKLFKTDLELGDDQIYLHDVPQEFTLPSCLVRLERAQLVRLNPQQGQWQLVFSIEYAYPRMTEPDRIEKLLDVLSTLMITIMKYPTLNNATFDTRASEGASGILETRGRDQGIEAIRFSVEAFEEPVAIPAVI